MKINRTVNLVATPPVVDLYFTQAEQGNHAGKNSIISANFPINPAECATVLGRWLAEHIFTTRFDDDASRCRLLLPITAQGEAIRQFADNLSRNREVRSVEATERILKGIEDWMVRQRKIIHAYGETVCDYSVIQFQWPVFGSAAAGKLKSNTPEAYFDACGGMIRGSGGVILGAGLGGAIPPDSLTRTMATKAGGGDNLLRRYKEHQAKSIGIVGVAK